MVLTFSVVWLGLYGWFAWDQTVNGIETDATILSRVDNEDLEVVFTTTDGTRVTTSVREYSDPDRHGVGETLRIRYVPRDPSIVRQAEEPTVQPVFFIVGGFLLLVAVGLVVYAWWFAPKPASD